MARFARSHGRTNGDGSLKDRGALSSERYRIRVTKVYVIGQIPCLRDVLSRFPEALRTPTDVSMLGLKYRSRAESVRINVELTIELGIIVQSGIYGGG